jgi:methylated-DNA-[protein]-cysteine S-methyltransferase
MARNPLPLVVPCHRVVAAGGLGGYGGGLPLKRRLLALEGAITLELPDATAVSSPSL